MGAHHSDGNISSIIPDLIETGIDILNSVQPGCLDLRHHINFFLLIYIEKFYFKNSINYY